MPYGDFDVGVGVWGIHNQLHPTINSEIWLLYLPWMSASGTKVFICAHDFSSECAALILSFNVYLNVLINWLELPQVIFSGLTALDFFHLYDLSGLIPWAVELNTTFCVHFNTYSLIIFTSHRVTILLAHFPIWSHILQPFFVRAYCVNNPFPNFVARGILWVIGWDNQYCNQPVQYSFDCE